jgi:uncharacterized Fe-S cluster-containing radical SAM superfamily enzyme
MKRVFEITRESGIPLIGLVQIGVIDRGSNLLQVRPTSVCNLNCAYCSADAGANSRFRVTDYVAEVNYLADWVAEVVKFKMESGCKSVEINLDSCGEIMTYPDIFKLIEKIREISGVSRISMQTNGTLLDREKIRELEKAGVKQINLSMNSLNPELCRKLSGCERYDIERLKGIAKEIRKSRMELLIAPVWIPRINDRDIVELVEFCKELDCKIGIQKYETHKYGRKMKGAREVTYFRFYKELEGLEKRTEKKLKLGPLDFHIHKAKRIPYKFVVGEAAEVEIKAPGWMKNERIGVARNRALTILDCNSNLGSRVKVKVIETSNGIYLAKKL